MTGGANGFSNCARERPAARACLHHDAARLDVKLEQNGGVVHGIQYLGLFGEGLGDEGGFRLEWVDALAGLIEGFDLGAPLVADHVDIAVGCLVGLELLPRDDAGQFRILLRLVDDGVLVVFDCWLYIHDII